MKPDSHSQHYSPAVDHLQFGVFSVPVTRYQAITSSTDSWPETESTTAPLILVLPALGVPAGKYGTLLETLAQRGCDCATCEMPGTGDSYPQPGRGANYGYSDLVFQWIPQLLAHLKQHYGREPTLILGHSIGGQIATLAARADLLGTTRVVSVASGHLDHRSWRGLKRVGVLIAALAALGSTRLLGYFPGQTLQFGGREASRLMRGWGRGIISGRFAPEYRLENATPESGRSLHITVQGDPFAPPAATAKLAALVGGETREIAATHPKGNPHLSWIKNPAPVLDMIQPWLATATAPLK
ncbi:alpha/beta fold hydrolase [Microbulbifer sp. ALW1]|uniref:alpha/beta fold hydrolase n=1 Tax=Microbulbifer sp. (strain ALW1) TaxID=1516059 RepID=UPI00135ACC52|nr:alpha/beta fold hydrolase [Microbulbifer sp. ALW1]